MRTFHILEGYHITSTPAVSLLRANISFQCFNYSPSFKSLFFPLNLFLYCPIKLHQTKSSKRWMKKKITYPVLHMTHLLKMSQDEFFYFYISIMLLTHIQYVVYCNTQVSFYSTITILHFVFMHLIFFLPQYSTWDLCLLSFILLITDHFSHLSKSFWILILQLPCSLFCFSIMYIFFKCALCSINQVMNENVALHQILAWPQQYSILYFLFVWKHNIGMSCSISCKQLCTYFVVIYPRTKYFCKLCMRM